MLRKKCAHTFWIWHAHNCCTLWLLREKKTWHSPKIVAGAADNKEKFSNETIKPVFPHSKIPSTSPHIKSRTAASLSLGSLSHHTCMIRPNLHPLSATTLQKTDVEGVLGRGGEVEGGGALATTLLTGFPPFLTRTVSSSQFKKFMLRIFWRSIFNCTISNGIWACMVFYLGPKIKITLNVVIRGYQPTLLMTLPAGKNPSGLRKPVDLCLKQVLR